MIYSALCAAVAVLPLVNDKAIVPAGIAAALTLGVVAYKDNGLRPLRSFDVFLWIALAGYLLAAVSASILSDTLIEGLRALGKLFGLAVIAALLIPLRSRLTENDARWLARALIGGTLFVMSWICLYILYERILHWPHPNQTAVEVSYLERILLYGYFWFKPASTVMAVVSLVAGIYLHRIGRPIAAVALVVGSIVTCDLVGSRTASIGLIIALVAGTLYHCLGRYRLRITLAALAVAFLLPVWMAVLDFKPEQISAQLNPMSSGAHSIVYRMHIWSFVADKITERPILGWGAGASKRLGTDQVGTLTDPIFGTLGEPIPVHPHNAVLQVWLEFGLVGAVFIYLMIARGLAIADRNIHSPAQRIWVFACGSLMACFFGFSFSIASSWWLVTVIVCVAVAAVFAQPPKPGDSGITEISGTAS